MTDIGQVVLEGNPYDGFVVPNCPNCLAEDKINSVVGGFSISWSSLTRPLVVKTGRHILWRIDT